jgi:hypothetical protein
VVPPHRHRIRLEPQRPGTSDQERASREGREGYHQLSAVFAAARLRFGRTGFERPYNFDFLTVTREAQEREIERGLLIHLRDLLLELGRGFAFVGSQLPLEVGDETFYIDLLFYHVRLHCYFVIELKTGKFKPEWAGKLNFYLSAVDDLFRTGPGAPTIGLLLCESHRSPIVEYTLRSIEKPIGVSTYRVTRELPEPVREELPSVEDLQEVVNKLRSEMESLRKEASDEQ